jgi:outer membrane protein
MKRFRFFCMSLVSVAVLALTWVGGAVRADPLKLSLDEAVKMALNQNRSVQQAQERVAAARGKYLEARSGVLPKLDFTASYTRLNPTPGIAFPLIPIGGGVTIGGGVFPIGSADNYDFKVSLSQSIFSWGKAQNGYHTADAQLKATREDSANTRQEIIAEVTKAYYGVLTTREFIQVAEEALSTAQEQQQVVQKRLDAGTVSEFDLLRTQVQVANTKPQVEKAHDGYEMALLALKNLIAVPLDSQIDLTGSLSYEPVSVDVKSATETAIANRPDLKSLADQKRALEYTLAIARAGLRPNLSLAASYEYKNPNVDEEVKWGSSIAASVILFTPLFDGFSTSGKVAQAASGVRQVDIAQKQAREGVSLEVSSAVLALKLAQANIQSQRENVDLAKESLRIGKVRYESGLITNLEVLDAELALTQAETNYLQALYDYQTARVNLEKAMGKL